MADHGKHIEMMREALRNLNPWEIIKDGDGFWVVKKGTRNKVHDSPHKNRADAIKHMRALYAAEGLSESEAKTREAKAIKG